MKPILLLFAVALFALAGCKKEEDTKKISFEFVCHKCPQNKSVTATFSALEGGKYYESRVVMPGSYYKSEEYFFAYPYNKRIGAQAEGAILDTGARLIVNIYENGILALTDTGVTNAVAGISAQAIIKY